MEERDGRPQMDEGDRRHSTWNRRAGRTGAQSYADKVSPDKVLDGLNGEEGLRSAFDPNENVRPSPTPARRALMG